MNRITLFVKCCLPFFSLILSVSCSQKCDNNISIIQGRTINGDDIHGDSLEVANFDVKQYLKIIDTLSSFILGECPSLIVDTLSHNDFLFNELKDTPIETLTSTMMQGLRYEFLFDKGAGIYKHSLILLTFDTERIADSLFAIIKDVALDKSGVPGLTYSNDYLTKQKNELYWVHSSCSFSYENHCKLVSALNNSLTSIEEQALQCKCGEVVCKEIFE